MKYLSILVLLALMITGCSKVDITGPETQINHEFLKVNVGQSNGIEGSFEASQNINGNNGGSISLYKSYTGVDGSAMTLSVDLVVPAGAFNGSRNIGFTVDNETGVLDFYPSMKFNVPVLLDYKITGADLSSYKKKDIDFFYLDGAKFVRVNYVSKKVVTPLGWLEVTGAKLGHFSRYGWATIVGEGGEEEPIDSTGESGSN